MTDQIVLGGKFTSLWQEAIVGHMLNGGSFLVKCVSLLDMHWFQAADVGFIFGQIVEFYNRYKKSPTKGELEGIIFNKKNMVYNEALPFQNKLNSCIIASKQIGIDVLSADMTSWIKMVMFKGALVRSGDMFNKQQHESAIEWVNKELKAINQASFDDARSVNWRETSEFKKTRAVEFTGCLTIGHPIFDNMFREGAVDPEKYKEAGKDPYGLNKLQTTQGGLVRGDSTIIIGPPNSGKTSTVISIIAANIMLEKKVLYVTHEQKWEDIMNKMYCCLTGFDTNTVVRPENTVKLDFMADKLDSFLTYIPWIKTGKMYAEDVIAEIVQAQELMKNKPGGDGTGYDLLVVDYPAKTKSKALNGNKNSLWEDIDNVYDQYVNLCLEHRFHGIFPAQTNREGFKIARDASDGRLVDMGDVGGAFSIVQKADNVITLNRFYAPNAKKALMVFNMVKSRSNSTGKRFASETDFACSRTHGFNLSSGVFTQSEPVTDDLAEQRVFGNIKEVKAVEAMGAKPILPPTTNPTEVSLPLPQGSDIATNNVVSINSTDKNNSN